MPPKLSMSNCVLISHLQLLLSEESYVNNLLYLSTSAFLHNIISLFRTWVVSTIWFFQTTAQTTSSRLSAWLAGKNKLFAGKIRCFNFVYFQRNIVQARDRPQHQSERLCGARPAQIIKHQTTQHGWSEIKQKYFCYK